MRTHESQRDYALQPRVVRQRYPGSRAEKIFNPNGVVWTGAAPACSRLYAPKYPSGLNAVQTVDPDLVGNDVRSF